MRLSVPFLTVVALVAVMLLAQGCSDTVNGLTPGSGNTFETPSDVAMTISDIVTDESYPILAPVSTASLFPFQILIGATPEYYYGRYVYNDGGSIDTGYMSFKIVKHNSSAAYFAEWTIHHTAAIDDPDNVTTVTADVDLGVPAAYNLTTNSISIRNALKRHVNFNIDVGGGSPIGVVDSGAVMFSEDFTTMIGGDEKLCFIATRGTASPTAVSNTDIIGSWGAFNFNVSTGGGITTNALSSDIFGAEDINGIINISAQNGDEDFFAGQTKLMDTITGVYVYSETTFNSSLASIDGVILYGPSGDSYVRYDLNTDEDFFSGDKFD